MYTIKKSKDQWIIKFKKPYLDRLLKAHIWVYPAFWTFLTKRLHFLGAPKRILLDFDQYEMFSIDNFGFTPIQVRTAELFINGLNCTMCGDIKDILEAIEYFADNCLGKSV